MMFPTMLRRRNAFSGYRIGQEILHTGGTVFYVWLTMAFMSGYVADRVSDAAKE